MKTGIVRGIGTAILVLGLAAPGLALAGDAKGCSILGTWLGFDPANNDALTGWVVSATGSSNNAGTNSLEYLNLDPTIGMLFPTAVRMNTLHGVWERTGGNTFNWTMIGYTVDAAGDIVWIGKLTGNTVTSDNCSVETILDTKLWIYAPDQNPYTGELMVLPYGVPNPLLFPTHYGFRATVEVPEGD